MAVSSQAKRFFALAPLCLGGLALLALAGCDSNQEETAPQCPVPHLLPDAATLTEFRPGGGTDLTDLVLSGRLLDVKGACSGIQGGSRVKTKAHVEMVLTRGPAATGSTVDVPYGIGVVQNGQVLDEKLLTAHVAFPANVNTVQVRGDDVNLMFATPKGTTAKVYSIYFWFQLTPDQLAANRNRK